MGVFSKTQFALPILNKFLKFLRFQIFIDFFREIIHERYNYIGTATNNTAEYQTIINALKTAEKFHRGHLQVYSDSNLAVQQINKKWKINYSHLSKLCSEVYRLCEKYEKVEFFHVGRSNPYIQKCDILCNERLDVEGFKK